MDAPAGRVALVAAYDALSALVESVDSAESWSATACEGWAVRDLVYHCLCDAQRGLVALNTPESAAPDRDAASYWGDWGPDPFGAANGRRFVRVVASMFGEWTQLRDLFGETAAAVCVAAANVEPGQPVATQQHVLAADDLLGTLATEATIHHLDLSAGLPSAPQPAPAALRYLRAQVLDRLLGRPAPSEWADERYARIVTGRAALTDTERDALGDVAARLPLFC